MKLDMKTFGIIDKIIIFGLLILCYIIFFHHLGEFTLRLWDEGRNAVNALEIVKNHNFIVTYFKGNPDMWNVKPPLHIWIVAIFFKLFGVGELTLRLPSAISATLVILLIYVFGFKVLNNKLIGLLGSLIILSSMGFPDTHVGRTGDYDALLVLFSFLGAIFSFIYFQNPSKKILYLAGLSWTLSVLTKGVAGLLLVPGIILFSILSNNIIKLFKDLYFWKLVIFFGLVIGAYYVCRELANHGYIQAVLNKDIFGRYQKDIGSGGSNFWYYWDLMASFRFQKWIYFIPISIISFFVTKEKIVKQFILYSYLLVVSYFIIISKSETKQFWYDAQLYPLASLLVATFIITLIERLPLLLRLFPVVILCFYLQRYVRTNIAYIHRPDLDKSMSCLKYGYLFRDKSINKDSFIGVHKDTSCSPFQFYLENNGSATKTIDDIDVGDNILTCDTPTLNEIERKYSIDTLFDNKDGCIGIKIQKLKSSIGRACTTAGRSGEGRPSPSS